MKLELDPGAQLIRLFRERQDPPIRSEQDLFYLLKLTLQAHGEEVILANSGSENYVRSARYAKPGAYGIYDDASPLRSAVDLYNARGSLLLNVMPLGDWYPVIPSLMGVMDWWPQ